MHAGAMVGFARRQRAGVGIQALVFRQQRRVDVQQAAAEPLHEFRGQDAHNPASATRPAPLASISAASAASKAARSAKSLTATTAVGTPRPAARARPPAVGRSAMTLTTWYRLSGCCAARAMASMLLPRPEMTTATG